MTIIIMMMMMMLMLMLMMMMMIIITIITLNVLHECTGIPVQDLIPHTTCARFKKGIKALIVWETRETLVIQKLTSCGWSLTAMRVLHVKILSFLYA